VILDCLQSVITCAAWSMVGATLGVLVDRAACRDHPLNRAEVSMHTSDDQVPVGPRRWRWWWRPTTSPIVPLFLVLMAMFTAGQAVQNRSRNDAQDVETRRVLACQVVYANAVADALDARTQASGEAQAALDRLVTAVAETLRTGPQANQRVQQAVEEYLEARARSRDAQQRNPYPAPPREVCTK
jgi:hypothetical protein